MALIPKVSSKGIMKVLSSPEVIAVGSAIILAPIIQPFINEFIQKVPLLKDHVTIGLIVVGVVILLVASKIGSTVIRAVVVGVAGAIVITGIAPQIEKLLGR